VQADGTDFVEASRIRCAAACTTRRRSVADLNVNIAAGPVDTMGAFCLNIQSVSRRAEELHEKDFVGLSDAPDGIHSVCGPRLHHHQYELRKRAGGGASQRFSDPALSIHAKCQPAALRPIRI
jgi:hypothetical protein